MKKAKAAKGKKDRPGRVRQHWSDPSHIVTKSYSQRELAKDLGWDRATVAKRIVLLDLRPDGKGRFSQDALEGLRESFAEGDDGEGGANIDPETGLTWFQAKEREQALKLRRVNEEEERAKGNHWVSTGKHHEVISAITSRLEQLPSKARSLLGLDGRQATDLQRLIDELRNEAAGQIEKIPTGAA